MNALTWLHLSDWHQKGHDFDRKVVRDALLNDLRSRAQIDPSVATVDFVIFSGDVAWQGKAEEYQAARRELFEPVLKELGLNPDKLFIIPGNHDLSRTHVQEMLPRELQQPFTSEAVMQKWLTDEKKRSRVLEPFEDFTAFVADFTGRKPAAYAHAWTGFIGNKTVGILCLNSALLCGRNLDPKGEVNDYGFLTLGEPQLLDALATIQGADLRLAVLHHPFEWLTGFDRNRTEQRLKQTCHFILRGHEHQPDFSLETSLAGQCAVIPAGACYERRTAADPRYTNAYNLVRLNFDAGEGVIFLRRWSERRNGGAWIEDADSHAGGKFSFRLPKELGTPAAPAPKPTATAPTPASAGPTTDTPAVAEYRRRLQADTAKLKLIGLGQGVHIELPIEQAYVPLNVVVARDLRNEATFRFDEKALGQREHVEENVLLGDIFKWAGRFAHRGVLLLGDPGAGKTTGARQFCWRVLQETDLAKALGLPAGTPPVFLRLRHLTPHHLAQGLSSFITDSVAAATLPPALAQPGPDLLARRGVLWIFDGLDEVVNENARVHVCDWLRQMLEERPSDFFLVTSRYQGYQGRVDLGPAFCQFHVRPLNPEQSAEFVGRWYRVVLQTLHGQAADIATKAEAEIASLLGLLQQPEYRIGRLRELPANPLMLTLLCVVHHQDHNLPRRRADLYAKCVRVLVEHWRQEVRERQGLGGFDPEAAEGVLACLAWWLHGKEHRTTHTLDELAPVAASALNDLAPAANLGRDGEAFLKRMRDESGILAMWSAGQCGFLHLTFQEYLTALHATREGKAKELVQHLGQSWWREVILLAVAAGSREFARQFFTELLQTDAVEREGALVDQCLEEARYPVLEPFLAALNAAAPSPGRQRALLQRLRTQEHPDLLPLGQKFVQSEDLEVAALAREILHRAGAGGGLPQVAVTGEAEGVFVDPRTGLAFVTIPAGEFDMGSETGDSDERPVHRVRLNRPFRLGKYPVTNAEYKRFLTANPKAQVPAEWNNSRFNDPHQPVVGVSWHDAQSYCKWAGCRLPTEAEWEYACRAGSTGRFCFGDDESLLEQYAWYAQNSGRQTRPVGQKRPNRWGLHDMHGNVWEWVQDWYGNNPAKAATDPAGPKNGPTRVVRGGSWFNDLPDFLSCSSRHYGTPGLRIYYLGFRVVWVGGSAG